VGRGFRFRRRRWTKARHYSAPGAPRFWPDQRKTFTVRGFLRDLVFWLRPVMLLAGCIILWPTLDPALIEPPSFLQTEPEKVSQSFTRCGVGRAWACVIDGDTFKLGERKIRVIGIDAPETHPSRCAEEARLGELATAKLQQLLNERPFEMVGRIDDMKDRYGRDLRVIRRLMPDGSYQNMADEMRSSGLAHRYAGGFKTGWC
jgi:endonuclease YncB( thermonuclease family)